MAQKYNMIKWPKLTFPAINLWSLPRMNISYPKQRWEDMYCSDEYGAYFKNKTIENKIALAKAKKQFKEIYIERGKSWEH